MHGTLYTDGGARGNPGPAGIGYVLTCGDKKIQHGEYIGEATNNLAEYQALRAGLQRALAEGVTDVQVRMDSELIVKQLQGSYRVKNEGLKPLYNDVKVLLRKFSSFSVEHVPRAKNKEADRLVNEALDASKK